MLKEELYDIDRFNRSLSDSLQKNADSQALNYGTLLMWDMETHLSAIAQYTPPTGFITLDKNLNPVKRQGADFYYGVSPELDSRTVMDAVAGLRFPDALALDSFIAEHYGLFALHTGQEAYLLPLARYIVLAFAGNFGVGFVADERLDNVRRLYDSTGRLFRAKDGTLTLCGCPTADLLAAMRCYRYQLTDCGWAITESEEGISLDTLYGLPNSVKLVGGDVFYSGVLLRPTKLEMLKNAFENSKTATLSIHFEKSTYATVYALDGNFLEHPLLSEETRLALSDFLNRDDACKKKLIESLSHESLSLSERFSAVNTYLSQSNNINQIGVTGNIITKDGILMLGKRGKKAIDNGKLYPSVNGNAEVTDHRVSFYRYSVYEDFPTIRLEEPRLDFLGEISREAYAELKLDINKQDWSCIGITLSGNQPPKKQSDTLYQSPSRRMHFNILFETEIGSSYADTVSRSRDAAESFENENILGIRPKCFRNTFSALGRGILSFFSWLLQSKDFIEATLLIVLFFNSSLFDIRLEAISVSDGISLALAVVILISYLSSLLHRGLEYGKRRKQIKNLMFFKTAPVSRVSGRLDKKLHRYTYHPVTYIAVKLHIQRKLRDSFFKTE